MSQPLHVCFRMHLAGAMLACLCATGSVALSQEQTSLPGFTSADLAKLKPVGDVCVSPNGTHVLFSARSSGYWLYDVATGKQHSVRGAMGAPRWSPDSRSIAFLGRVGERYGLLWRRLEGNSLGEPEFIAPVSGTNHPLPERGESFAWSPDSSRLVYVSSVAGPEGNAAQGDPRVITRYLYKPKSGSSFNDNRRLQLFLVDLATKQSRQLTHEPYHHHSVDWSKADEVLFVSNRGGDSDRVFNDDVFALNVLTGTTRRLTNTPSLEARPAWSPDGASIAIMATTRARTSSETRMEDDHAWVMSPDGTNRRNVSKVLDNRLTGCQWSGDGQWLYVSVMERGDIRLYRIPAHREGKPEPIEPILPQHGRITSWSISQAGVLAYAMTTPNSPGELYLRTPQSASSIRLTKLNDELLSQRRLAETDRFSFKAKDGLTVEAFLTKPLAIDAAKKHPLIVFCHGGPHSRMTPQFLLWAQIYAAKGWATLMVNYRGSTDYGQKFTDAILGDQNGAEAQDVLSGVDEALARYAWIDASRMGIEGGSYGGQLVNWIVTQTDRFKAAISVAGISNLVSFNYTAYYHDYLAVEFGAYPHEGDLMDRLWQRSPIRHVARVRTPVMFIHGENDNDVPVAEAEQFFIALKDVGVDTVMVLYPGEGHGIQQAKHQVDVLDRSAAWYEKHFRRDGKDTGNR